MSFHSWTVNGYGICTDDIEVKVDRLKNLIALAPKFEARFNEWLGDEEITDENVEEIMNDFSFDNLNCCGFADIIRAVIYECEGVELSTCDDYDCRQYLLLEPIYPWHYCFDEYVKRFPTTDKVEELMNKYIAVLTDKKIVFDYQEVENGG